MDYLEWVEANLTRLPVMVDRHRVSFWHTPPGKPRILLVHGIGGDFAGLVPLARELAATYQVIILELPGHGKSAEVPLRAAADLQRWFGAALSVARREFGSVETVCAHSFGCIAVLGKETVKNERIILINPVPTPNHTYENYSRAILNSKYFWAHIYNWPLFILLRGLALARLRTPAALRRIRFTGLHPRPTYRQVVYQAGLVDIILERPDYTHLRHGMIVRVVCGMQDTMAQERDWLDMRNVFGDSEIIFLAGGHLLPIESPERVASIIRQDVVH